MTRYDFALLSLAASALSQAVEPPIPFNAQSGLLNFPVTCAIFGIFNQTFETTIKATAPLFGGTGQEIYYSDVSVDVTFPTNIVNLVTALGAKTAVADITANLDLSNASPSSLQAFSESVNISLSLGQEAHLIVPTVAPIGPVTLGAAGNIHRITLGTITVVLNLYSSSGGTVLFPITTTCGNQNVDFVVGSVAINSTSGAAPYQPALTGALSLPTTPNGTESGGFHIPYDCVFGPLGNNAVDLVLTGTVPLYAAPGKPFSLTNGQAYLRVPASVAHVALVGWPSTKAFKTTITSLTVDFQNASPATIQAAGSGITTTANVGDGTQDVIIQIPNQGAADLTIGPVSGTTAGTIASFSVGTANATTELVDASGNVLFSLDVTCQVPFELDLAAIVITNQVPGQYTFL